MEILILIIQQPEAMVVVKLHQNLLIDQPQPDNKIDVIGEYLN